MPSKPNEVQTGTVNEIQVNLQLNLVRFYPKSGSHVEYGPVITGPATRALAGQKFKISYKTEGPTAKGLLYFAVFHGEIGFHSDYWKKNGQKVRIPGQESRGCIRIPDSTVRAFYESVSEGDSVVVISESGWRTPKYGK